jgi:hypothetical protein
MCIAIITQIGSSLPFFSFYLSLLLTVISAGLKLLCSFLYRKHINHMHLLYFLLLPSRNTLPLAWPVLFWCLSVVQWDFCLGITPVHALWLSQFNPPPPHCISLQVPLCSPGWPWTWDPLHLWNEVVGLQLCTTTLSFLQNLFLWF